MSCWSGSGLVAIILAGVAVLAAPQAPGQTATPCDEVEPAELAFSLSVLPEDPVVGESVILQAQITNLNGGLAGLPAYQLHDAARRFEIEEVLASSPQVTLVRYLLRAVEPGDTTLSVSVNFETASGCADAPVFFFTTVTSEELPITVGQAPTNTATATPDGTDTPEPDGTDTPEPPTALPTPTPTETAIVIPTECPSPPPDFLITPHTTAVPNPARSGERVDLDARASTGPVVEYFWTQRSGPFARLMGCFPTSHGCDDPNPHFIAPEVSSPTTLSFELLLTTRDDGTTHCITTTVEVEVVPAEATPTATEGAPSATPTDGMMTPPPPGTPTATSHETATPTPTPTCAPTGTPYCAEACPPCPTVGAGCPAESCGPCTIEPTCGPGEVRACGTRDPLGCCGCATPTPPLPTVTPGGPPCAGDCNNDGMVVVNELVLGVNIALGGEGTEACAALDVNEDGMVSINELVIAVGNALNGCPGE